MLFGRFAARMLAADSALTLMKRLHFSRVPDNRLKRNRQLIFGQTLSEVNLVSWISIPAPGPALQRLVLVGVRVTDDRSRGGFRRTVQTTDLRREIRFQIDMIAAMINTNPIDPPAASIMNSISHTIGTMASIVQSAVFPQRFRLTTKARGDKDAD